MAACRGGVALWGRYVRSPGTRKPVTEHCWRVSQTQKGPSNKHSRPISSASWALAPPNSLRFLSDRQPWLSHPYHHASQTQKAHGPEEEWDQAVGLCVLVQAGDTDDQRTLVEVPLFGKRRAGELLALEDRKPAEFFFPLTTVDGRREDDISVGVWGRAGERCAGSFRSLFEAEGCPAPFMWGSNFFCFHCPGVEVLPGPRDKLSPGGEALPGPRDKLSPGIGEGLGWQAAGVALPPFVPCSGTDVRGEEGGRSPREREEEEKLALMYDRLNAELPTFFLKNHDYSMYSTNVEFINGLLNTKTRGLVLYQAMVTLWRLLCLCYYVDARLEVLKLTKHGEDGSVKARWRVNGLPLYSWVLRFYKKDKTELYRTYDAFSTFYLGPDGLIHRHRVEKVMPARPPILPRVTTLLTGVLVALGVQDHRPALNLLPLLVSSLCQIRH